MARGISRCLHGISTRRQNWMQGVGLAWSSGSRQEGGGSTRQEAAEAAVATPEKRREAEGLAALPTEGWQPAWASGQGRPQALIEGWLGGWCSSVCGCSCAGPAVSGPCAEPRGKCGKEASRTGGASAPVGGRRSSHRAAHSRAHRWRRR